MCGICGAYGLLDKSLLERMCNKISHRGPDGWGHYIDTDIMLGMRRLNVIDLYTGNQPIYNEDKSIVIIYNGEIYNFHENRKSLEQSGHVFSTKTDTETIVHLYEEFGDNFVTKLRGMFAFALWDIKRKRLLLARDRIGIKPLYYYYKNGKLLFASEMKALLEYSGITKEINYNALHNYLTYMYVPAPDTIFDGIYKLKPGHLAVYEKDNLRLEKYWSGNIEYHNIPKNEYEVAATLNELIEESIKMHLISDVPLGVFLSGGTDSGTVVAIMAEVAKERIKTFSVGFEDRVFNELENARLVANRYKTEHHEFIIKPPKMEDIENILCYFDEPFADSSAVPTYYISRYARGSVTVALSGDGGDEVFGGYGNYKVDKINSIYRKLPTFLEKKIMPFLLNELLSKCDCYLKNLQLKKIISMTKMSQEYGHILWLSCFDNDYKRKLYNKEELKDQLIYDPIVKYLPFFIDNNTDFINKCMYVDIKTILPDCYLTKVDRMGMANSLEVRVPLLDHKLIEFALAMPSRYKLNNLKTKYLLKKVMNNRLPKKIIYGKKKGFSIPLARWLVEDFSGLVSKYLSKEIVKKRGYFNHEYITCLYNEHLSSKRDNSKLIWALLCFEIWYNKYFK